jgi:hypothetical protein
MGWRHALKPWMKHSSKTRGMMGELSLDQASGEVRMSQAK